MTAYEYDNRNGESPTVGCAPGAVLISNKPPASTGIIRPRRELAVGQYSVKCVCVCVGGGGGEVEVRIAAQGDKPWFLFPLISYIYSACIIIKLLLICFDWCVC